MKALDEYILTALFVLLVRQDFIFWHFLKIYLDEETYGLSLPTDVHWQATTRFVFA